MGHKFSSTRFGVRLPVSRHAQRPAHDIINDEESQISLPPTEQNILIWYDPNIDTDPEEQTQSMLSNITDHVRFFAVESDFLNYTQRNELDQKTIFLILSGRVAQNILRQIHVLPQLKSVYIYCGLRDKYESLQGEFRKIEAICTEADDLSAALKADITHTTVFNFYHMGAEKSIRDLTKNGAEFLWFQLLHEILLKIPYHTEQAKQELLTHCRNYYRGINERAMTDIDTFERDYQSTNAIQEYTKDNFLHNIINCALRTEDVDQLYTFRYYIVDLCNNLYEESKNFRRRQSNKRQSNIKVYRGQPMKLKELNKIRDNIRCLIATNGFLSTTFKLDVAKRFASSTNTLSSSSSEHTKNDNLYGVIFEIDVDLTKVQYIIMADISEVSDYLEEREVLFGLGATFYVTGIEELNGVYFIRLEATDDGRKIAEEYKQLRLSEIPHSSKDDSINFIIFGQLLIQMGEYQKAINFFKNLLPENAMELPGQTTTELEQSYTANILFSLGDAYLSEGNCDVAVKYLTQSLEHFTRLKTQNGIAHSKARLASALVSKEQYPNAKRYYKEAIALYKQMANQKLNIAYCQNGLGDIYISRQKYSRARHHILQAHDMRKQQLPKNHPDIAMSQYNMGRLCYHEGDGDENARKYLEEALKCKRKIFPSYHNSIGCNLSLLGKVYESLGDRNKALECLNEARECYQQQRNGELSQKKIAEIQQDIDRILNKLAILNNKLKKVATNDSVIKS